MSSLLWFPVTLLDLQVFHHHERETLLPNITFLQIYNNSLYLHSIMLHFYMLTCQAKNSITGSEVAVPPPIALFSFSKQLGTLHYHTQTTSS